MRALPALDACGCIVRKAPTSDLRIRAEVSIGWKAGRTAASNSSRALFADRTCPRWRLGGRFASLGGIQGRLFRINPFHGVGFVEAIADVFHVLLEQRFRTVASGGDHRVIGVRAI